MKLSRRALLQKVDYGLHGRIGQVLTLMRRNGDTSRNDRESKNDSE